MLNFKYMHSAEKACNTTLEDENASQHVTSIVVTALCKSSLKLSLRTSVTSSHVTCYLLLLNSLSMMDHARSRLVVLKSRLGHGLGHGLVAYEHGLRLVSFTTRSLFSISIFFLVTCLLMCWPDCEVTMAVDCHTLLPSH